MTYQLRAGARIHHHPKKERDRLAARNAEIRRVYESRDYKNFAELGARFGISGVRVHQIIYGRISR
jgi:hypothetical protein